MKKHKRVIILFSGGYDSTLLLRMAIALQMEIYCVLFDYGQKHIAELSFAEDALKKRGIEYWRLKIPISDIVVSKLTTTEAGTPYPGVSEWHVPSRNLTFMAFAVGLAESLGIDLIWYGANYEDRKNLFPDCYQDWVFELNRLLELNGSATIRVEAPLLGMSKDLIREVGHNIFTIEDGEVFSGYGEA